MAPKKILKELSPEARDKVNRAMAALGREGYAIWGFVFAAQSGAERLLADGHDFTVLEVFNNAGEDSIPMFIVKTENALKVLRTQQPLGTNVPDEFQRVINEANQHMPEGKKISFEPHANRKPN